MSLATDLLTTEEAAQLLSLHVSQVTRLAASGRLPGTKRAGVWLFEREKVERFKLSYKGRGGKKKQTE